MGIASKEKRRSGLELLRIIAMFLIVFGHFCGQSDVMRFVDPHSATAVIVAILGNASRVSVNLFLIVAVWFMVGRDFKAERLIKTWVTVFLWGGVSTIVAGLLGAGLGIKAIFQCFLPILGRQLWFASAYMILYLCTPFLNMILKWERKQLRTFLCILFLFCSLIPTITDFNETFADNELWFIFVFIFVGYIKTYYLGSIGKHYIMDGLLGVILYLMLVLAKYGAEISDVRIINTVANLANDYLVNFKSIPNFICALLIFSFFNVIDFKSKIVNDLAKGSFPVYIVHQTKVLYPILWTWILNESCIAGGAYSVLKSLIIIAAFYLIITFFENIRSKNRFFYKTHLYSVMEKKLMGIF